jgi:endonuclease-3
MGALPRHTTRKAPAARVGSLADRTRRAAEIGRLLAARWPDAECELRHTSAFELIVGTILAAQSTDKLVNTVTPTLLARWPDARALAAADPGELERMIHSTGFFRMKARSLLGMARAVAERHGGEVPRTMAELVALPGVGRKTANVVLSTIWGITEGVVVDTHVTRLSQRLGLTAQADAVKIEQDLMEILPREAWGRFADRLIWHGRRVCFARQPDCEHCELPPLCPATLIPASRVRAMRKVSA